MTFGSKNKICTLNTLLCRLYVVVINPESPVMHGCHVKERNKSTLELIKHKHVQIWIVHVLFPVSAVLCLLEESASVSVFVSVFGVCVYL